MKAKLIKPNPDNPRLIKDGKFKKLVQSLKEFPEMAVVRPVVINEDNMILGGNMRYRAMIEAGWDDIPITQVKGWTKEQQKQFIIKDNVSGGDWDWDMLVEQWDTETLDNWGLETDDGWGSNDVEVEEDEPPEVDESEPPKSKLGEIYQLGRHRVMCGSATEEKDVDLLLGEHQIDLYLTDPPYNVDYTGKTKEGLKMKNDVLGDDEYFSFLVDSFRLMDEHFKPGASFYIFHADTEGFNLRAALRQVNWQLRQCLVWVKQSLVMGRQDYQWRHEPILYGWKAGAAHAWYANRKQTSVLEYDRPSRSEDHPTMKPLKMLAYLIQNSSKASDMVVDGFLGSGSTLVACEHTDRTCYGMELDPKYVDVIRKRYAKLTNNNELPNNWEELTPVVQ